MHRCTDIVETTDNSAELSSQMHYNTSAVCCCCSVAVVKLCCKCGFVFKIYNSQKDPFYACEVSLYCESFTWSSTWLVTPTMKMIVDDHTALQTLPVSIKKPIFVHCNFCSRALKALTEVTFNTLAVRG